MLCLVWRTSAGVRVNSLCQGAQEAERERWLKQHLRRGGGDAFCRLLISVKSSELMSKGGPGISWSLVSIFPTPE